METQEHSMRIKILFFFFQSILSLSLVAHENVIQLDAYRVSGRSSNLAGETLSASQGIVGNTELAYRPILRTGEILETIPGLIATQHSGTGKANQYFLRGFNLDHGSDFATYLDGMPVNIPTHGHGQGYTDVNFIIPELVSTIEYKKGPYYASIGDFSSAGSTQISTMHALISGFAVLNIGQDDYLRAVVADTVEWNEGTLLAAGETQSYDGPWDIGEDLKKINALVKYNRRTEVSSLSLSFMGYDSSWDSADQIPLRAVESGLISHLGSIDEDLGGETSRYSLSANYSIVSGDSHLRANAYAIRYDLNLWSNFTYFLDDPVNGDEFEQADERMIYGGGIDYTSYHQEIFGKDTRQTAGVQFRYDDVQKVGLYKTTARTRLSTVREDSVNELALGAFYENEIFWNSKLRSILGIRADYYNFEVNSNLAENSGDADDTLLNPKLSLIYAINATSEAFLSLGYGFHSNDARGTTINVDPVDGETPVEKVDPLVQSFGAEIGSRFFVHNRLNTSLSLWYLELDSELLFVGDAGSTEASRPSQRYGLEFANYLTLDDGLSLELDVSITDARFDDDDPAGDEIPGALSTVLSAAITKQTSQGYLASLRVRYFGESPLIEDGSIESEGSMILNSRIGYQDERFAAYLDILNLLDSDDNDITYFYPSRLPGEAAEGVEDIHYHIIEPRTIRAYLQIRF